MIVLPGSLGVKLLTQKWLSEGWIAYVSSLVIHIFKKRKFPFIVNSDEYRR